jgi:inhibitor of KinA
MWQMWKLKRCLNFTFPTFSHLTTISSYRIFPISESAITVDFGNFIDEGVNRRILSLFYYFNENPLEGMIEAIPSYSSITIYYDVFTLRKNDPLSTAFEQMKKKVEEILERPVPENTLTSRHMRIPVCYDGCDLAFISKEKNISIAGIIQVHSFPVYRVYMLGFLPGFAYLGLLDEKIRMPRKPQPAQVAAGSIGIAGSQTGIYPLSSPGGWQIIGRTPLTLFNAAQTEPALLMAGDTVQFYSISAYEFANY